MAKLVPKSENQIIGSMARTIASKGGPTDLNPGSVFLLLLEAAAREDFAQYYQMVQILKNFNLDYTTGSDLDNRAFEYGLKRRLAQKATGKITILREEGFEKISASFYTGFRSRLAGDTTLPLNNAEDFPASGTLIIGRNTPNEEEVAYSTAPVDFTNYWIITLDAPLSNDHSLEESVILKQGTDLTIPSGTVVQVPATSRSEAVNFSTINDVILLAGEESVSDVDVRCTEAGIQGNIGVEAINGTAAFPSPPFAGARALNESAFTSGTDRESDPKLRARIKAFIQGLSQSTKSGIASAIDGLVDPETAKRVVSSNVIIPDNVGLPVKIYIDDGTGFEPSFEDQGQETILAEAAGGETRLQLDLFPLVKAQIETLNEEPFDLSTNGLTLQVEVGSDSEVISFFTSQFQLPEAATSEEVVSAINNTSNLLEARTSQVGKKIVISAKRDINESVRIAGGTANVASKLNFPTSTRETFYLYKNDQLLSKDGETATLDSSLTAPYDFSGSDKTLLIIVDGKTANQQTVTIRESDFSSPAAAASASAAQVAAIINEQLVGAEALDNNGRVRIVSNTKLSEKSKLKVDSSDVATVLGLSLTEVVGKNSDYTLNPELGVIELSEALVAGDLITAGSRNTRGFLTATNPEDYSFVGGENLLIEIDGTPFVVTFSAQTNSSAADVAEEANAQISGGQFVTRTILGQTFLELRTNSYENGSVEVLVGGAANSILGFPEAEVATSITPHTASVRSQASGPFFFVEGQTLVVVLDNDPAGRTFIVTMDFDGEVTSGTSTTVFAASGLTSIFTKANELADFRVAFKSGDNSTSESIEEVSNPTPGTFRYFYENTPPNFEDFDIGDQISVSGLTNAGNNGNYLITDLNVVNTVFAPVISRALDNPDTLTPVLGDRYLVAPTANTVLSNAVLDKDVSNPSALTPSVNDRYIIEADANTVLLAPVLEVQVDSSLALQIHGYRYLINGVGLNDFAGQNYKIAEYNGVGSPGWLFYTPTDLDVVLDQDTGDLYQFDQGGGTWLVNDWGGKAGQVATWNGTAWTFSIPQEDEVRTVNDESLIYQYDLTTNTWERNDWGSKANQIAEYNGSSWTFTPATNNDTVLVTNESETYQLVSGTWVIFRFWVEVSSTTGVIETGASGTGLISQVRVIQGYNEITGQISLTQPTRAIPAPSDAIIVMPSTKENVVDYFNNTRVTSLSGRAEIDLADDGSFVQISSKANGSEGFVQVTGGRANEELQFSTTKVQGLRAYSYYTGLIKLVHKTIYGDETDLVAFPGVGAAGVKFKILAPTVQEIAFSLNVTLAEGVSLSSIESDVKSAVISYVNNLGVGGEVILASVIDAIMELEGIRDVEILSPAANVAVAENERATTKASIITVS